jgi:hypothetical protein
MPGKRQRNQNKYPRTEKYFKWSTDFDWKIQNIEQYS